MIELPVSFAPSPTCPRPPSTSHSIAERIGFHIDDDDAAVADESRFDDVTVTSQLPRQSHGLRPAAAVDRLDSTSPTRWAVTDPLHKPNDILSLRGDVLSSDDSVLAARPEIANAGRVMATGGNDAAAVGCPMDVDEFFDDDDDDDVDLDAEVCHFLSHRVQPNVDGETSREERERRPDSDVADAEYSSSMMTTERCVGEVDYEASVGGPSDETACSASSAAAVGSSSIDVRRRRRPAGSASLRRRHRDGCQPTTDDGDRCERPYLNFEKMQVALNTYCPTYKRSKI